uniref:Mediator of RNA polymerase II transcription subunit 6 n=1 Tax=Heterorhabditis bacteriophora TaxID=37862 RepID=A0A1I7X7Q8_HETBA
MGEALADPIRYENLFPGYATSLKAESYLRELSRLSVPASAVQSGAVIFAEDGSVVLKAVSQKRESSPVLQPQQVQVPQSVAPVPVLMADSVKRSTPSPLLRDPVLIPNNENHRDEQHSDDGDGLVRAPAEPDVVAERPRPDVVPVQGGPDLLQAGGHRVTHPEVVSDVGEVRWSDDDDFGDVEGGNDINLDDLNLDDED